MTDYRLRNYDLLYIERGRGTLTWRHAAIFGTIAAIALAGVAAYLTDRFNPASSGFMAAPEAYAAQPAPPADIQFARPAAAPSGS